MKRLVLTLITSFAVFSLMIACSSPTGASGPQGPGALKAGYFIDGPLAGLSYETSSGLTGTTDADGRYQFRAGDSVQFRIGTQALGAEVAADDTVTPLTVCGATGLDASPAGTKASNLIRLLLALDTGDNPYGLTIPAGAAAAVADLDVEAMISSLTFQSQAQALIGEITSVDPASVVIPDTSAAQAHWELSKELAQELSAVTDDTLILAVKIPSGFEGKQLQLSYHAKTLLPGMTSYQSGQYHTITAGDDGIVVFRGKLHSSQWRLTLSLLKNDDRVVAGDLLSFFHTNGFAQALPTDFDLDLTQGRRILQADLSSGAAINVSTVHSVSGILVMPKVLPDMTAWSGAASPTDIGATFSLFNDLKNNSASVAMFSVRLPMGTSGGWASGSYDNPSTAEVESIDCWEIPFATSLPAGFSYSLQSYYRTTWPGGYETYAFDSISNLSAPVTTLKLKDVTWGVPSSY